MEGAKMAEPPVTFAEARRLFASGRFDESEAIFLKLDKADAITGKAKAGLGMIALQFGELPKAHRLFREALEQNPKNADALYGMGVVSENSSKQYFERALRSNPKHTGASKSVRQSANATSSTKRPKSATEEKHIPVQRSGEAVRAAPESDIDRSYTGELLMERRPRMRSYSGVVFLMIASLTLPIVLVLLTDEFIPGFLTAPIPILLLLFLMLVAQYYSYKVLLYENRIDTEIGLIFRRQRSVWLYQIKDVQMTRNPVELLTGDATIALTKAIGNEKSEVLKLFGLGNARVMKSLYEELREASLVERRRIKKMWLE